MKTIESMSELKKVYDKPQMEVEEMEVQWEFMSGETLSALISMTWTADDVSNWEMYADEVGSYTAEQLGCPNKF